MGFGQIVVSQVNVFKTVRRQLLVKGLALFITIDSDTDKNVSRFAAGQPVIELGNIPVADNLPAEAE